MKQLRWSLTKSEELKKVRGVSFEEMIHHELIAVKRHPRRRHQKIMLFKRRGYIWVVPYVKSDDEIFLKTMFPSRKYTKLFNQEGLYEKTH